MVRDAMLYLHEIIDIVGTGQEVDPETRRRAWPASSSAYRGSWAPGKVIGSTDRCRGSRRGDDAGSDGEHSTNPPGKVDAAPAPVVVQATEWRSGGFDRILEPAPGSPTRDQLRAAGLRAWVCVHTIARTQPGQRPAYLAAAAESLVPLLAARAAR